MSESWIWAAISICSGVIGTSLFIRYKLEAGARQLSDHLTTDATFHTSVVDRLGRMETKIDFLVGKQHDERRGRPR